MDQVTKFRQNIKREEWKSIISECRASGMSVKAWCKANGIVEQTYYKNLNPTGCLTPSRFYAMLITTRMQEDKKGEHLRWILYWKR